MIPETRFYATDAEKVVLRHALMSYRNAIATRSRDDALYPMADGFELTVADELVQRLDRESAFRLSHDKEQSEAPATCGELDTYRNGPCRRELGHAGNHSAVGCSEGC